MLSLWKPQNELLRWTRGFDDLFRNDFGQGDRALRFTPAVDIEETDDSFVLRADLPGVEEKDIEVTVHEGTLLLSGKRESAKDAQDGSYRERSFGAFHRQFRLGKGVAEAGIKASYNNGELKVVLPKKEEVKPRQIKVAAK